MSAGPRPVWLTSADSLRWLSPAGMSLIAGMSEPVKCARCPEFYDLRKVDTVASSWSDDVGWTAPCCGLWATDRRPLRGFAPVSLEPVTLV